MGMWGHLKCSLWKSIPYREDREYIGDKLRAGRCSNTEKLTTFTQKKMLLREHSRIVAEARTHLPRDDDEELSELIGRLPLNPYKVFYHISCLLPSATLCIITALLISFTVYLCFAN